MASSGVAVGEPVAVSEPLLSVDALLRQVPGLVPDRLLRMEQVCEMVALRPSRIYELVNEGSFPKAKKIGGARRWRQSEVARWIEGLPEAGERETSK